MIWSAKEGKATESMKRRETRLSAEMAREVTVEVGEEEMTNAAVSGGSGGDGDV